MKIVQRAILLSVISIFLAYFSVGVFKEAELDFWEKWEAAYSERFISKICRDGGVSQEEVLLFHSGLTYNGAVIEIRIDEYKQEQDLNRTFYYSIVVWEEVKESLWEEGCYCFEEGSIIRLTVLLQEHGREKVFRRFGRISKVSRGAENYGT